MKITILGAGVIGVTSAYYLAKAGHEVTVLDRQSGPALETSFANAGEISPGYASPWAAPGIPQKALKWLFMKHAPLIIRPMVDAATWRWMTAMLRNCTSARYAVNKGRMVRLAEYSRDCLIALRGETGIAYDHRTQGTLQLFRTAKQLDGIGKDIEVLKADGVPFEVLDPAGCVAAEPGLQPVRDKIVGGLRLPNDETGDCFKFTNELQRRAEALGVQFRFGVDIRRLRQEGNRIVAVETAEGEIRSDIFVAALGSYTPALLKPLGLRLPVYPVKGYSITVPIVDETRAPVSTIMDETYKIAITRLGDRIRVGGMAEIAGFSSALPQTRRATLEHSVEDLFGGAGNQRQATFWSGLRPMTPDGTPVVGATRFANLFLNSGHGTLGWTMACGSGRVLSDLISGTKPEIETADLAISRYH
ncbi:MULTISPECIES: D-amino acid dehydrogenase [unclassified Ensifer]|uniref:D-amino acid dehydrogenase n=1 Tax=unclassified Ensifer TaxID=2633371 RepID=UPI00070D8A00|nr:MULTISPECIES: D-amino acid dehydrogenase [unclassified Ensifer]MDP9633279.1 D-amino-acid dehydrogenase [Ensifer adhaerens]KQW54748.1 amino acid dehydrogenase [Ensifer sp. Root1252]KQW73768.1 amino acid dehydrogenase [Ensifer sp. Root127]KQY69936.1 amino acid dehydrogenase [Ensifer sp. Root142]KRC77353.1 amino acid dehydrogenase [Ensifer sp. Root231]